MINELSLKLALWLSVVSVLIYQSSLLDMNSRLKHSILGVGEHLFSKVLEMILLLGW